MKPYNCSCVKRLFIGIPVAVSMSFRNNFLKLREKFNEVIIANWTRIEQWHITLHFFGEISTDKIPSIINCIKISYENLIAQKVNIKQIGFFGKVSNPRVIWLGIEPDKEIIFFSRLLSESLYEQGYEVDQRAFSPHITLARIKRVKDLKAFHELINVHFDAIFDVVVLDKVVLYESILNSHGSTYVPLFTMSLKAV
ncbi:MAG: RNA 2',3'-cyclic phosphodiesterase [Bacteroidales bacterium]|nr:RNA 2',3'-cyclic phosphodiesterase [Bacteroidales bacterium]